MLDLPIRVDIATGERLPPSGIDPYSLPWVQGAAATVHRRTRDRYAGQITDLREKLEVLRSRGTRELDPSDPRFEPTYGPQRRPLELRAMDQRSPKSSPDLQFRGVSPFARGQEAS